MKMAAIVCLVLAVCVVAAAGSAAAQGGAILPSSSSVSFDCDFTESIFTVNSIYIVHTLAPQASAAQFRVIDNWSAYGAIVVGVTISGLWITQGDIFTGMTISYVGCRPLPQVLARIDYLPTSATPACTPVLSIGPDLTSSYLAPITFDCSSTPQALAAVGGTIWVNVDASCACNVGTEQSTWGKLKSLYQ